MSPSLYNKNKLKNKLCLNNLSTFLGFFSLMICEKEQYLFLFINCQKKTSSSLSIGKGHKKNGRNWQRYQYSFGPWRGDILTA